MYSFGCIIYVTIKKIWQLKPHVPDLPQDSDKFQSLRDVPQFANTCIALSEKVWLNFTFLGLRKQWVFLFFECKIICYIILKMPYLIMYTYSLFRF